MELRQLLATAWKRRMVVAVVVVAAVAAAALLAATRPARYEATATMALTPDVSRGQGFIASDNYSALLGTYAEAAKSEVIRRRAATVLGRPLPGTVTTSTVAGTGILRITGQAEVPQDAARTASAVAQAFRQSIAGNQLVVANLVTPPTVPTSAVQPRPPLIIGTALLLGLLGGILLAFATEALRRRVESAEDVAELTDAPILGRLPRQRALNRRPAQSVWEEPRMASLQEAYRALRTNVEFIAHRDARVIQVTSPEAGQGKSTVVANLAVALAQIGIETIVLDADMRRPRQHQVFGLDNTAGLSTTLASPHAELPLLETEHEHLRVVPSGPMPPDPTELLHIRFERVVETLRATGAMVIIDSPPILPVSDARLIAPRTDGVIFVLSSGLQKPAVVRSALERLELLHVRLLGVVLNQSDDGLDAAGGYYYGTEREHGTARLEDMAMPAALSEPDAVGARRAPTPH